MKKSRNSVITQLGGTWLFLENCQNHNKYFPDLIEQSIEAWQELNEAEDAPERKPVKEFNKPEIEKIGENYYFIAGLKFLHGHLSNPPPQEKNNSYMADKNRGMLKHSWDLFSLTFGTPTSPCTIWGDF